MSQNVPDERASEWLDELEAIANRITDSEEDWWPFGFLRPAPQRPISSAHVVAMSVLYGLPAALLMVVMDSTLRGGGMKNDDVFAFLAWVCAAFFVFYRSTFAFFWNRRAARLESLDARRRAWAKGQSPSPPE